MNVYYNPVKTYQGEGCLNKLLDFTRQVGKEDAPVLLLLCRKEMEEVEGISQLLQQLGERAMVICFPHSNPDIHQLYTLYTQTKDRQPGLVIAVGGGSTMDVGKSLCCLYSMEISSPQQLREIIAEKKYQAPSCPWIGVATTAGTGSEVTCWATIWDPQCNVKYSIERPDNYAWAALADPQLLYTMPLGLGVSSAVDALAHAAESYWAKATNAVSRALALSAIRIVMEHIDDLLQDKKEAYQFMSKGSMLAGLAFSNTKTTACHSISYPLTMRYGIPHGVAVGLLLSPVLRLNTQAFSDQELLLDAFGVKDAQQLEKKIVQLLSDAGYGVTLRDWGVKESELPELAAHGMTKGRADNNPAPLTQQVIEEILRSIF